MRSNIVHALLSGACVSVSVCLCADEITMPTAESCALFDVCAVCIYCAACLHNLPLSLIECTSIMFLGTHSQRARTPGRPRAQTVKHKQTVIIVARRRSGDNFIKCKRASREMQRDSWHIAHDDGNTYVCTGLLFHATTRSHTHLQFVYDYKPHHRRDAER